MIDPVIRGVILSESRIAGFVDGGQTLTGSAAAAQEITAELSGAVELTGKVSQAVELVGAVNTDETLNGEVHVYGDAPVYDGKYAVTPKMEEQTLQTAMKMLRDNVKVKPIPIQRTSNEFGGTTVYIGMEVT